MSADGGIPKTAFDTLIERMKSDVRELKTRAPSPADRHASAERLEGVLNSAIREARVKAETVRAGIADGAEVLREEMRAHPALSISAAFAAGYMIGKSIVGIKRE